MKESSPSEINQSEEIEQTETEKIDPVSKFTITQEKLLSDLDKTEQTQKNLLTSLETQKILLSRLSELISLQKKILEKQDQCLNNVQKQTDTESNQNEGESDHSTFGKQEFTLFETLENEYISLQEEYNQILKQLSSPEGYLKSSYSRSSQSSSVSSDTPSSKSRRLSHSPTKARSGYNPAVAPSSLTENLNRVSISTGMDLFIGGDIPGSYSQLINVNLNEGLLRENRSSSKVQFMLGTNYSDVKLTKKFGVDEKTLREERERETIQAQINYKRTTEEGEKEIKKALQEKNISKKALDLLGHDPQKKKLMKTLGIDDERILKK